MPFGRVYINQNDTMVYVSRDVIDGLHCTQYHHELWGISSNANKKFGLFTTPSFTNFNIYCSIFTYLETTEWIFNLCACYNQFPFIFTNTFLDIMHEITAEVDGG